VQHLLGIGHLARSSRIAAALVDDGFDVTVVTGGAPIAGFPGPGVKTVTLPPVTSGDEGFSGLVDLQGRPIDDDFKKRRSETLLQAYWDCRPDIVIVEAFPFGRRQMRFELMPLIEAIEATSPRPLLATSVRDILQERVHGDPAFATIDKTFPLARAIRAEVTYTGLVAAPPSPAATERFDILVSVGGGAAGRGLVSSTIAAARNANNGWKWCLITGPNLPKDEFDAIARDVTPGLSIFRFREDFASLLTGARLSVSQAGYNTVCDVLRAGCRSLLVPFAAGGETEQTVRALMLEELGLATVLMEKDLTPEGLAQAIEQALVAPRPSAHRLDLEGARHSAQILRERHRTRSLKMGPGT
ncbi:MAG: glycosyl transferase, partial [Mesorhizobium sp.]